MNTKLIVKTARYTGAYFSAKSCNLEIMVDLLFLFRIRKIKPR